MTRVYRIVLIAAASAGAGTCLGQKESHILPLQYGAPVVGAPFSGTRVLDYEPAENSSDPVAVHAEEKFFRDSAGRTRSEIAYANRLPTIDILDFVAHIRYHWTVGDTVAMRFPIKEVPATESRPAEKLDADSPLVEGVPTRHNRSVLGSDGKIDQIVEAWYSPDLRVSLVTIIDKPSSGKTSYRYEHVSRAEPDEALFRVPAGFTVEDNSSAPPPPPVVTAKAANGPAGSPMQDTLVQHGGLVTRPPDPPYMADPKFQKALEEAKNRRQTVADQLENWKHASKVAHGQCVECLHQMILLEVRTSAWKDAVNNAQQLEALSAEPREKLFAEAERGQALMQYNYGSPKPEQLAQADAAFRDVLAKAPREKNILFQEGRVLAMQGKNDEAKALFERYVEMVPASDRMRMRAERFSDDPHLATLAMAPPFRMITSEGEELQLDDMNGKVVLLDFWATWCGPCKESLPEIARIAKDYANDPMLVVISVSQDADANAWKAFIQQNNMTWPQYRDANNALGSAYGVSAIPHFFTIDTNGILKTEQVGANADVRNIVNDLVKKAHKAEAQKAKAGDKAGQ